MTMHTNRTLNAAALLALLTTATGAFAQATGSENSSQPQPAPASSRRPSRATPDHPVISMPWWSQPSSIQVLPMGASSPARATPAGKSGVSNIRTFNHILTTVLKGQVVDEQGNDIYMPNVGKLKIPISFIQGAENELFLPEGTHRTFQHVCQKNGSDNYVWISFPNYGHMDCFVGKTAVTDIYPIICAELGKTN